MVINLRSTGGIAMIWLAAVVGVSATAWVAIDRAGRDITDASVNTLPPAPLKTPTLGTEPLLPPVGSSPTPTLSRRPTGTAATSPSARTPGPSAVPTASAAPSSSSTTRRWVAQRHWAPRSPTTRVAPTARDRSISVTGGLVSVRCTGAVIGLRVAQPENGWRVQVDAFRAGRIVVTFQMGEEESVRRTAVTAVCARGTPTFDVNNG